ncbi:GntR family transcriptional regulator [Devosia naphthalenivorans]|uniref:GntR family transcriptional regulator n=1 Tax=Devosia naphthalenivorans TaxID=2082392 RepID=UPI000D339A6D|nr:GntR family transcriptional regulator [Devosia naphthalenivorans]
MKEDDNRDESEPAAPASRLSLYQVVRDDLLVRLAAGEWRSGDSLPSEGELARQYKVSTGTLRKAIDHLVDKHLLDRRQGKGTFVLSRGGAKIALHLFFHLIGKDGSRELPHFRKLLSIKHRRCLDDEAKFLDIRGNSRVIEMRRLRGFSDGGLMLEQVILAERLFPDFDKKLSRALPVFLYEFYDREFRVSVLETVETVGAVSATREQAMLLNCEQGAALLEIERVSFSFAGVPVELRRSWCQSLDRRYSIASPKVEV